VLDAEMDQISVRRHSEALAEDAGVSQLREPRSRGDVGHADRLGDVRGQVVRDPFQRLRMPAARRVAGVELLEETQDDPRCQVLRLELYEDGRARVRLEALRASAGGGSKCRRAQAHDAPEGRRKVLTG